MVLTLLCLAIKLTGSRPASLSDRSGDQVCDYQSAVTVAQVLVRLGSAPQGFSRETVLPYLTAISAIAESVAKSRQPASPALQDAVGRMVADTQQVIADF